MREYLAQTRSRLPELPSARAVQFSGEVTLANRGTGTAGIAGIGNGQREPQREARFHSLISTLSSRILGATAPSEPTTLESCLGEIGCYLDVDEIAFAWYDDSYEHIDTGVVWSRLGQYPMADQYCFADYPVTTGQLLAGTPVVIDCVASDRTIENGLRSTLREEGCTSVVFLPLSIEGRPVGFGAATLYSGTRNWSRREIEELQSVANVVAISMERRRIEERLRLSEARHRAVLANTLNTVFSVDTRYRLLTSNPAGRAAFRRVFGKEPRLGSSLLDELPSRVRGPWKERLDRGLAGEYVATEDIWRVDGTDYHTELEFHPILEGENVKGVAIFGRDVTARRQAEARVQLALAEVSRLKQQLEYENSYLREELTLEKKLGNLVGQEPRWISVLDEVDRVAATDATVLVLGESGTGKELIAHSIHERGHRRGRPLIAINAAALAGTLADSELFGHVRGAFTGAAHDRAGRFELANGGTLFIDEIGELPLETQAKLLRVLEDQIVVPVGGNRAKQVDVRIVAATNRDLDIEVEEGRFRKDLYYRLNVYPIRLPPLRERTDDIPMLVDHFVEQFCQRHRKRISSVSETLLEQLQSYDWPGNIRELQNVVERLVIRAEGAVLGGGTNDPLCLEMSSRVSKRGARPLTLESVEREHIVAVLDRSDWIIGGENGAARSLGLHESTLRSRMKKLGIRRTPE